MFSSRGELRIGRERLRNHAERLANAVGIGANVVSGDPRRAGSGRRQRGHHADQRGLARAIRAEQAEDLALLDVKLTSLTATRSPNFFSRCSTSIACISNSLGRQSRANQLFFSGGGSSTVAVMPVNSRRSGFGTDTLIANVLMSRFVRLTSRCVAKSPSTPLKKTCLR